MDAVSWSWADLRAPRDRAWRPVVRCELNGWSALAAFLAGPGHAFEVPARVGMVREWIDGVEQPPRPPTADELAGVHSDMANYLALAGVPAPPEGVEWEIVLPFGHDPQAFWSELYREMGDATDYRPETAPAVAAAMRAALDRVLAQ